MQLVLLLETSYIAKLARPGSAEIQNRKYLVINECNLLGYTLLHQVQFKREILCSEHSVIVFLHISGFAFGLCLDNPFQPVGQVRYSFLDMSDVILL